MKNFPEVYLRKKSLLHAFVIAIGTVLAAYVFFRLTAPLLAQENNEPEKSDMLCIERMKEFVPPRTAEFGQKVDDLLLLKDPNSGLIDKAMVEYRQYRKEVIEKFNEAISDRVFTRFSAKIPTYPECDRYVGAALNNAQQSFINLTTMSSQIKKSSRLLRKYRDLNAKIRDMTYQIGLMKGHYDAFTKKINYWSPYCL